MLINKITFAICAASLLALTACGGSSGGNQVHDDNSDTHDHSQYPANKKFVGVSQEGSEGKLTTMGADNLYTVLFNGAEYDIDTSTTFDTGVVDIVKSAISGAKGNGGAIFSKGMLSYATFGAVADYDMASHQLYNYRAFFQGQATPVENMPTNSQVVYYVGRAIQQYAKDRPDLKEGVMSANVDFAAKKLNVELSEIKVPVSINGADITGNRFNAEHNGVQWAGGFFGPEATEIAGFASKKGEWSAEFGGVQIENTVTQ